MKKQQKKAFTLVELLVVIAILAILASVAVVGYTAFIKNAAVSNDENLATQMTRYLDALKADSTGKYYNKDITAGDVRELTKEILSEASLAELVAESAKYGYNFYFDLTEDEYVVKRAGDVGRNARNSIFGIEIYAEGEETDNSAPERRLENCFTEGNRYFFLDTVGSEIAEIIEGFYKFDGSKDTFSDLMTKVDQLTGNDAAIKTFVDNSVIVADGTNYKVTSTPENIIFIDDVKYIGTAFSEWSTETKDWSSTVVSNVANYVLATTTGNITVPSSVEVIEKDALNLGTKEESASPVIVIDKSVAEVAGMAGEKFTNVEITLNDGVAYEVTENNEIKNTETNETVELVLTYENPLNSFQIKAEEKENLVVNMINSQKEKIAYVVWISGASFDMYSYNRVGENGLPSHVQDNEINWSIDDTTLATINAGTGLITFNETRPTTEKNNFTVTATVGEGENAITQTYKVYASAVCGAVVNLAGKEVTGDSTHTLVFNNTVDGEMGSYSISVVPEYSCYEENATINPDIALNVTFANEMLTWEEGSTVIGVAESASGTISETISIQCGSYTAITKDVTLFDAAKLPYAVKNANIRYAGNSNTLSASDFFVVNPETTAPDDVKLMVYKNASDVKSMQFDPDRTKVSNDTEDTFYVSSNEVDGFNTEFQFHGTQTSGAVVLCLVSGDKIVSPEVSVTIVDGYNVRTATQSDINWKAGAQSYVLLNDLALWEGGNKTNSANYIVIGSGQTLWGNLCELNIQNGYYKANDADTDSDKDSSSGIIGLWGTIRDTKIVGDTYTGNNFGISVSQNYGASAVTSKNDAAQLINCYISGCRSPLRVESNIEVTNCVFFGGRYANIDMVSAKTLTLKGTNYTINQGYGGSVGVGIAAWFNDSTKSIVNEGVLKQYNFLNNSTKSNLFKIEYAIMGYGVIVDTPALFESILGNEAYEYLKFYLSTDTEKNNPFVNAGIICLDYEATGNVSVTGISNYKGEEKTLDLCSDDLYNLSIFGKKPVKSICDEANISSNHMPNKVWTPDPTIKAYQDMFAESQNAEYMATFEPDNFELSWAE